tara:strand:+ start:173 stop:286 length:114 start_codon:yes stop_codon:yes gene_type:complete
MVVPEVVVKVASVVMEALLVQPVLEELEALAQSQVLR